MNKMREYERGREDGLDLALRIVKQGGIEALEKEIKFRNITGVHTSLATKDLDKASQKIKEMTLDTFTILGIAVLHDCFGFGQIRCQRFMDGMDKGLSTLQKIWQHGRTISTVSRSRSELIWRLDGIIKRKEPASGRGKGIPGFLER